MTQKQLVGRVKSLWQYPVKSMAGNQINTAHIAHFGMVGDRGWAVRDENAGEITTVRHTPKLLHCQTHYDGVPVTGDIPAVVVTLPNGITCHSNNLVELNAKLSDFLGKPVSLSSLKPKTDFKHYQLKNMHGARSLKKQFATNKLPDYSSLSWRKLLELSVFATPLGRYYDIHPLHLVTTNSLAKLSEITPAGSFCVQRFRPNMLIESAASEPSFEEFGWLGGKLYIGNVIIHCEVRTVRCSMPAQPQHAYNLAKDTAVLRTIDKHTDRHLGIYASVEQAGSVSVGDVVYWQPAKTSFVQKRFQQLSAQLRNRYVHTMLHGIDTLADIQKRFRR